MARLLSIGEVARTCGLSIRSLRHLETHGLLRPRRTEAGRRVYGADDLQTLAKIQLLRHAGYMLSQIATFMRSPRLDPQGLLDLQIAQTMQQRDEAVRLLAHLHESRRLLDDDRALDIDGLCHIIREGQRIVTQKNMQPVIERYFNDDERRRWEKVGAELFPAETQSGYQKQWEALIARVERAIASGLTPESPEGQALASDWKALQAPMVEALGHEQWAKAATMYSEMESWQTEDRQAPFSAAVYAFVSKAAKASSPSPSPQGPSQGTSVRS